MQETLAKFSNKFAGPAWQKSVHGVKLFNNLSEDIINSSNSKQFCTKLKKMCIKDS